MAPTSVTRHALLMDAICGAKFFHNEIIWQRTSAHNDPARYGRVHDVLLFYSKTHRKTWNQQYESPDDTYYSAHDFEKDEEGRLYRKRDLTAPTHGESLSGQYTWNGKHPPRGRMWSFTQENMEKLVSEGRVVYTRTGMPRLKIYEDALRGISYQDIWVNRDLWLNSAARERLGYPTQKPAALLERIITSSSNEDDIALDPFCGCGTAIHAAQKLGRRWIGIDITHLAISLIEKRLNDAFPGIQYEVHGTPKDIAGAQNLANRNKYQFQWWAVSLVNAVPYGGKKKGADSGIDGIIYFKPDGKQTEKAIVSVKGGENVSVPMIRDLAYVVDREQAKLGIFLTLAPPTRSMQTEAVKAGFYPTPFHGNLPKIQLFTIAELFAGHKPKIPFVDTATFRHARQEETAQQGRLFG